MLVIGVLDNIREAFEDRKDTLLTLFDFSKAFDCISPQEATAKTAKVQSVWRGDRVVA